MDTVFVALRVLLSLAAVVGLLWFLQRRITRGTRSTRASKLVTVVTRQGLAQKASVVVIDVEGKRYLLGVTEHSVTVLDANELPAELAAEAVAPVLTAVPNAAPLNSSKANAAAFDSALTSAGAGDFSASPSPLQGSILSLDTWKRAAAAMRQSR